MTKHVCQALGLALSLALTAPGCGGDGPSLVNLTGKVTQGGKPVEGAAVMFMPALSSKDAQPAQDTTGPDGSFTLMTDGRSGAVPGQYTVTIVKALPTATSKDSDDDPFMATMAPGSPKGKKAASGPEQFTYEREVPPQGEVLDFELDEKTSSKS